MNLNLYTMEIRQHFSAFLIWCLSLAGLIILGFAFYPVLTQNDFLSQVDVLFKNPMMKNLMSAFNVNADQLRHLASFYTAYTSIYVILIGCLYSINLSSRILAREELMKTADFLFTRPLSRVEIYVSKLMAHITLLVILNLVTACAGILGMELFKTPDSRVIFVTEKTRSQMAAAFRKEPERFRTVFRLTDQDYLQYTFARVRDGMRSDPDKTAEYQFDPQVLDALLAEIGTDPDKFLEKMKAAPEEYRQRLNLPGVSAAEFLQGLSQSEIELADFKTALQSDPAMYVELFETDPVKYLTPYKTDRPGFRTLLADFGLPPALEHSIFIYYPSGNYLVHCFYIFLLMLCFGSMGLALSVFIRRNKSVTGASVGITLGFYFINSISNLSPVTDPLGYISPFKFVNSDILNPAYGLELWRVVYFAGLSLILLGAGLLVFRRKDVLV